MGVVLDDSDPLFPCSDGQRRLWIVDHLQDGSLPYHVAATWRFSTAPDLDRLERALGWVAVWHEPLRTTFATCDDVVMQRVRRRVEVALERIDASSLPPDATVDTWLDAATERRFDLESGPVWRCSWLSDDHGGGWLHIVMHHIATDAWSMETFTRHLASAYAASDEGADLQAQAPTVRFVDAVADRSKATGGARHRDALATAAARLEGLEPLDLPSDRTRPVRPSFGADTIEARIAGVAPTLEAIVREQGATMQMAVLALVSSLVHRFCRSDDVAHLVPYWGRERSDLLELVGFFIDTMVVRTRHTVTSSFRDLLERTRLASIDAYGTSSVSFGALVDALQPERDAGRHPLSTISVQYHQIRRSDLDLLGSIGQRMPHRQRFTAFDLELMFRTEGDDLLGRWVFATDLFDRSTIERFSSAFEQLVRQACDEPDMPLDGFEIVTGEERRQVRTWSVGRAHATPPTTVIAALDEAVRGNEERPALVAGDRTWSYRSLHAASTRLAVDLVRSGVRVGDTVGILMPRSSRSVVALLAVLRAGGTAVPVDPAWPASRVLSVLTDAMVRTVVTDDERSTRRIDGDWTLVTFTDSDLDVGDDPSTLDEHLLPAPHDVHPNDRALVYYTSGSTGTPKGVEIEQQAIVRLATNGHAINGGGDGRTLHAGAVAFDATTWEVFGTLLCGGTVVVCPVPTTPATVAATLVEQRVDRAWLTSALFSSLVDDHLEAFATLSHVATGGETVSPRHARALLDRFGARLHLFDGYGPTECTTFTTGHRVSLDDTERPDGIPIGTPLDGMSTWVVTEGGALAPIGIPGQLVVVGYGVARGYLGKPTATAEAFVDPPPAARDIWDGDGSSDERRAYVTGDLVAWTQDGVLDFRGRSDEQVKLRGVRIEPSEIEYVLAQVPGVAQVAVVVRRDDPDDPDASTTRAPGPSEPYLAAYWVARARSGTDLDVPTKPTRDTFVQHARTWLPSAVIPIVYVELPSLPMTAQGKVDRRALPRPSFDLAHDETAWTPTEKKIVDAWRAVLGRHDIGLHDDFFEMGGHSLAAAIVVRKIEDVVERTLSLTDIFERKTVAGLARYVDDRSNAASAPRTVAHLAGGGPKDPLFVVHGPHGHVLWALPWVRRFDSDRPVYAIQAIGLDGTMRPDESVEAMAKRYAHEIVSMELRGPVHLTGHSAGGWFAWAVAAQLRAAGIDVGQLVLLDTIDTTRLPRRLHAESLFWTTLGLVPKRLGSIVSAKPARWGPLLVGRIAGFARRLSRAANAPRSSRPSSIGGTGTFAGIVDPSTIDVADQARRLARGEEVPIHEEYFAVLHSRYAPPTLDVDVSVLAAKGMGEAARRLFRRMTTGHVVVETVVDDHMDFVRADRAATVAQAIEASLDVWDGRADT